MFQEFEDFDDAINFVAEEKHGCKYILTDGLTAVKALYGRNCGKLVETGAKSFPTLQGFISRIDWNQDFVDEINRETLWLAETGQVESLEEYKSRKNQACTSQESSTIDFMTMRVFFICAYGAFVAFAIHMAIDRQREVPDNIADLDHSNVAPSSVYDVDDDNDNDIMKVALRI